MRIPFSQLNKGDKLYDPNYSTLEVVCTKINGTYFLRDDGAKVYCNPKVKIRPA